jgi:hypothetical protein
MVVATANTPVGAQQAMPQRTIVPGRVYYACRLSQSMASGTLEAVKDIGEDGILLGSNATWQSSFRSGDQNRSALVRLPNPQDSASVSIVWPAAFLPPDYRPNPLDSSNGSIWIASQFRDDILANRKKEPWTQIIVDRSNNFYQSKVDGKVWFALPVAHPVLMTEPTEQAEFRMQLGDLFAWASDVDVLTIYKLRVGKRKLSRQEGPQLPIGARRIVGTATLNVAALKHLTTDIQERLIGWKTPADFKTSCSRGVEEEEDTGDIIVT